MRTGVRRDPRSYGKVVIDQEDVDLIRKSFVKAVKAALRAGFAAMGEDTGMTRGSLIPAADEIGDRTISSYAGARERKGWMSMDGEYHPGELRNSERGTQEGDGYTVIQYGRLGRLVFRFSQAINIFQWGAHESSWGVLEKMDEAFVEAASESIDELLANPSFIKFGG